MHASSDPDVGAILAALGHAHAGHVTRVQGGWDTAIWRVEDGASTYALRVFRPDQAAQCDRERTVMAAAAAARLPVPAVHASTLSEQRPALLLGWCSGQPVLEALRARPVSVWQLGYAMGELQARIHAAPVSKALHGLVSDWIGRAGAEEQALRHRLEAVSPDRAALLHLDYHPLNVMTADGALTCVLDWANAALGDPRADVARTVSLLRLAPLPPGVPVALGVGLRLVLEGTWRAGYQHVGGRHQDMPLFYAWAGAMMVRDLAPKLGRPGVWLQPRDLRRMRGWTRAWKRRAGVID